MRNLLENAFGVVIFPINPKHRAVQGVHCYPNCAKGGTTMFDRVILRGTEGGLKGQMLVLENEMKYILGRSRDCSLFLHDPHLLISRYHCQITISAPYVHIQDLGSLNGTYVNGEKIGQRVKGQSFEEALQGEHAEYPLWHGDKLRIGDNTLQVEVDPPPPSAARDVRLANSVKLATTKVQFQLLARPSLVGDSSINRTACSGS